MDLFPDFKEWLALLNRRGAEYVVVGAYALAHHGIPRNTGDLDLYVRPGPRLPRVRGVLRAQDRAADALPRRGLRGGDSRRRRRGGPRRVDLRAEGAREREVGPAVPRDPVRPAPARDAAPAEGREGDGAGAASGGGALRASRRKRDRVGVPGLPVRAGHGRGGVASGGFRPPDRLRVRRRGMGESRGAARRGLGPRAPSRRRPRVDLVPGTDPSRWPTGTGAS
jgi:hypothetical protein